VPKLILVACGFVYFFIPFTSFPSTDEVLRRADTPEWRPTGHVAVMTSRGGRWYVRVA